MSSETIHDVMTSLARLVEEAVRSEDAPVAVRLSDFSRARNWGEDGATVYLVPHAISVNEQGLRASPRERLVEREDGGEVYRFFVPPMPLSLHFLMVPCASSPEQELKLLGRLYQILQEQPVLSGAQVQGAGVEADDRLTLSPDSLLPAERVLASFTAGGAPPRLTVPCLIRFSLRSERVIREARPSRSIAGAVRKV